MTRNKKFKLFSIIFEKHLTFKKNNCIIRNIKKKDWKMIYYSEKTQKGNSSYSINSKKEADDRAKFLDDNGCTNCTDCIRCTSCKGCKDCKDCTDCTRCEDCEDCKGCEDCTRCEDCTFCTDCEDCKDCRC